MKNITPKNKKIFAIILIAILLIISAIVGVFIYQKYQYQKELDTYTTQITAYHDSFSNTDDRSEKIEILQNISKDFTSYNKTDTPLDEIIKQYNDEIDAMKSCFTSEYEKTISDNTLDNLEEITDKESINTAKANLSALSETITSETDIVCAEEEALTYTDSINALITSYENRITAIEEQEKKEAEEKAKKEAEEKARQAAQEAQQASSSSNYNSSGSSSGGSSSGSSSGGSSGSSNSSGTYQWEKWENSDGSWTYHENNGDGWQSSDSAGNTWTDDDLSEWLD